MYVYVCSYGLLRVMMAKSCVVTLLWVVTCVDAHMSSTVSLHSSNTDRCVCMWLQLGASACDGSEGLCGDDSWGKLPVTLKLGHPVKKKQHKGTLELQVNSLVFLLSSGSCRLIIQGMHAYV